MDMLGEIVAKLREANGWSMKDLALRVQRSGATNVQYQHIQQLEKNPSTSPRYIVELAVAFGKSVEDLRSWLEGMPAFGPNDGHDAGDSEVREPVRPAYADKQGLEPLEQELIDSYRACLPEIQLALRSLAAASAKQKATRHARRAR